MDRIDTILVSPITTQSRSQFASITSHVTGIDAVVYGVTSLTVLNLPVYCHPVTPLR